MATKVIRFKVEKETKRTVRYQEVTEGAPIIGTLYVQKRALKDMEKVDGETGWPELEIEMRSV